MACPKTLVLTLAFLALAAGALAQLQTLNHTYFTAAVTVKQILNPCPKAETDFPVVETSISKVHEAMLSGKLSCSGLVKAYLQRIKSYDKLTGLNAISSVNPKVLKIAKEKDKQLKKYRSQIAAGGSPSVPSLFCIPIVFKDNYDTVGVPTTNGAQCFKDNFPKKDATQVAQVKAAGAIWLAKTNLMEFAMGGTWSVGGHYGVVRNPYDLNRATAGSSGGTGAAVAANFGLIGFGTDTCVSIRGPAAHQSLVGIRPSLGLTSRAGIVPLRLNWDTGSPLGRTVEDVAKVFTVLTGPDPRDPLTAQSKNYTVPTDYTKYLNASGLAGARIGIFREFLNQNLNAPPVGGISQLPDPDYLKAFDAAMEVMRAAGATIVDNFTLAPVYKQILDNSTDLIRNANGTLSPPTFRQGGSSFVLMDGAYENTQGCAVFKFDMQAYLNTAGTKFKKFEDLAMSNCMHPSTYNGVRLVPLAVNYSLTSYYTDPRFSGVKCKSCDQYNDCPCRMKLRDYLIQKMDELKLDAVAYLTFNNPPVFIGSNDPAGNANCQLSSITGAPAINVPAGFVRKNSAQPFGGQQTSLPVGLQLLSRPFDEATLFKLSYAFEQASKARVPPVAFPECGAAGAMAPLAGRRLLQSGELAMDDAAMEEMARAMAADPEAMI